MIEFITDIDRIGTNSDKYWDYITSMLENPKDIWSECFKIQSNDYVRNLVNLTVFNGKRISEEDLKNSFYPNN